MLDAQPAQPLVPTSARRAQAATQGRGHAPTRAPQRGRCGLRVERPRPTALLSPLGRSARGVLCSGARVRRHATIPAPTQRAQPRRHGNRVRSPIGGERLPDHPVVAHHGHLDPPHRYQAPRRNPVRCWGPSRGPSQHDHPGRPSSRNATHPTAARHHHRCPASEAHGPAARSRYLARCHRTCRHCVIQCHHCRSAHEHPLDHQRHSRVRLNGTHPESRPPCPSPEIFCCWGARRHQSGPSGRWGSRSWR